MTLDEWLHLKARAEAAREAYLRRRFSPAALWQWQQQAIEALAQLRPDLKRRRQPHAPAPPSAATPHAPTEP